MKCGAGIPARVDFSNHKYSKTMDIPNVTTPKRM